LTFKNDDLGGKFIHYCVITLSGSIILYSVLSLVIHGIYSYIYLPWNGRAVIHSISLFSLSLSFLTYYLMLGYLYPLARTIICLAMSVWSIQAYDFIWSLFSQAVRGCGLSWTALLAVIIATFLLERLDDKHGIFRLSPTWTGRRLALIILYAIFLLSFEGLVNSGFFQAMALYDIGAGPDPNVGNVYWLVGKFMVFWLFLPLIHRRDYKVPLRLDPRVLIW